MEHTIETLKNGGLDKEGKTKLLWVIALLTALLIWFGATIVEIENERYALSLEMCTLLDPAGIESVVERDQCLDDIETRTSWVWHLYYALGG